MSYLNIELVNDDDCSTRMTKGDLVKLYNLHSYGAYDFAIPQAVVDDIREKLEISDPASGFVWFYPRDRRIEFPFPLTKYWEDKIDEYDKICGTSYSRKNIKSTFNTLS